MKNIGVAWRCSKTLIEELDFEELAVDERKVRYIYLCMLDDILILELMIWWYINPRIDDILILEFVHSRVRSSVMWKEIMWRLSG